MACVTTDQLADITGDLTAVLAHIAAIDAALAGPMINGTKSYVFDSGTGRQQEVFASPLEMIETRSKLAATRDRLRRNVNGTSIMTTRLRR